MGKHKIDKYLKSKYQHLIILEKLTSIIIKLLVAKSIILGIKYVNIMLSLKY